MPTADGCLHRPRPFSRFGTVYALLSTVALSSVIAQALWARGLGGTALEDTEAASSKA